MARRTQAICGESRTRVVVRGGGTDLTKPARSMGSCSSSFFVDADDWSDIVRGEDMRWLRLDGRNDVRDLS